ncbi:MAG: ribose-phosphate pyrophosphokinase [Chloroflexi bacterium 13_1_20CM_54_36]|nr:MAG: ribose-phosphate pyrophosphokinase [Chloroflexi bacterium 13_1_20CM_54_36]OLE35813.1 MAG: ribose-phosphate pyrophosphokinase [Ktedonobacter sp. 13_1_20CM_3_54_15]TMD80266.1 MAG: ribose-phosphate pyrophosphokinase [Chloroflexota bacterium]
MSYDEMLVFAGSGSRKLTARICDYLRIPQGKNETLHFSDGNTFVRILENVRGRRVYLVQSTVFPANGNFMELLFWVDAFKRAGAETVTVIIPYFSYAKGDKKDEPRVSIRARVCADAIEAAGADRVVTMDLHAPQIQGFFHLPVDNLYALPVVVDRILSKGLEDIIVVSPDVGFAKQARRYASLLGTSMAIADKERIAHDEKASILQIIGNVKGKTAVVVDDFTISGGTLARVSETLIEQGAKAVYAVVTHGVLTAGSVERIDKSPIKQLLITDTVENQPVTFSPKIEVVSVASLFAEAIKRIHNRESISEMFS